MTLIFTIFLGLILVIYVTGGFCFLTGLFFPNRGRSKNIPFVSVIIAARNEEAVIENCLRSVLDQTYPVDQFEIIVIDDRSTDKTYEIITRLAKSDSKIKIVRITEITAGVSGKKNALEKGIESARGEILLFTDADCIVKSTWIALMVSAMAPTVGFVIGFSEVRAATFFEEFQQQDFHALMFAACGVANLGIPWSASGQNMAYRREAYDKVGGFDTVRHRISGDDVLMMNLIRKETDYTVVFAMDPGSHVTTAPSSTLGKFLHQRARWASNGEMMARMNPPFFTYLCAAYAMSVILIIGSLTSFLSSAALVPTVFGWTVKLVVDFSVMATGCRELDKKFSPAGFLSWFILQSPYVVYAGLKGMLGKFTWK